MSRLIEIDSSPSLMSDRLNQLKKIRSQMRLQGMAPNDYRHHLSKLISLVQIRVARFIHQIWGLFRDNSLAKITHQVESAWLNL